MSPPSPVYLHQVLITDHPDPETLLPPDLQENVRSLRACYPRATYRLWNTPAVEALMRERFEPEVLTCFRALSGFSSKCDLARMCIVYTQGGLYSDIGLRHFHNVAPPDSFGIVAFQDLQTGAPLWCAVSAAILWCQAGRPEPRIAIDLILQNWRDRYYGPLPVYVCGPVVFGAALVKAMAQVDFRANDHEYYVGHIAGMYPFTAQSSISFVTPDRKVVAIRFGSISQIKDGSLATNDYGELWASRRAYGETEVTWRATDARVLVGPRGQRTASGVAVNAGEEGLISFGPYIRLKAGRYRLRAEFAPRATGPVKIEITSGGSTRLHAYSDFAAAGDAPAPREIEFYCAEDVGDVEFRVFSFGPPGAELLSLTLIDEL